MSDMEFVSLPKEAAQVVFDALVQSMDACSGFLDYKDWCALRQLAHYLGVDPDSVLNQNDTKSHGYRVVPKPHEAWSVITEDNPAPPGAKVFVDSWGRNLYRKPPVLVPWPDPTAPLTDEPIGIDDE